ncbi:unnamed protein product [Prorocentrum cordatum]|uniref:Uncharacterized protein n=1 Tax=Prorocentrum cordatum TaxID=2364126 RepID=A0ABN9V990_9DINO|nr:unnamed protein product [Polarella glacialis]
MVEVYIPEKGIAGRLDLARRQADEDDLPDDLLLLRELEEHRRHPSAPHSALVLAKIREIAPNSTAAESPSYAGAAVAPAIGAAPLAGGVAPEGGGAAAPQPGAHQEPGPRFAPGVRGEPGGEAAAQPQGLDL